MPPKFKLKTHKKTNNNTPQGVGEHAYEGAAARFATRLLKIVTRLAKTPGKVFWKAQSQELLSEESSCRAAFIKHVGYDTFLKLLFRLL